MNEKQVESHLNKKIKELNGLSIKLISVNYTGLPDRIVLLPEGKIIFIELKAPLKKPRARQLYVHRQLEALGFTVKVLDTIEKVDSFIGELGGAYGI